MEAKIEVPMQSVAFAAFAEHMTPEKEDRKGGRSNRAATLPTDSPRSSVVVRGASLSPPNPTGISASSSSSSSSSSGSFLVTVGDLDDISSISKGKNDGWGAEQWVVVLAIGVGAACATAHHIRLSLRVSILYLAVSLIQLVGVIALVVVMNAWIHGTPLTGKLSVDQRQTPGNESPIEVHLHHYCWSFFLACFCRFPKDRASAVCQALLVGWMINGLALYGPDAIWTVREDLLADEIRGDYTCGRCVDVISHR